MPLIETPPSKTGFLWDIFISHAGSERARAEQLYGLISPRASTFLDSKCIRPGDRWQEVLTEALNGSCVAAVLISTASQSSYFQQDDCASAISLARDSNNERRVVPVYLDGMPRSTDWNLFGLHVLHGISVPDSGGLDGTARRLVDLVVTGRGMSKPEVQDHVLHQFPQIRVASDKIDERLVEAYARAFSQARALMFLDRANAFRLEADANATVIDTVDLRPIETVQPINWWHGVFTEARLHGARMIAALLLTATRYEFPENVLVLRENLLNSLRMKTN